MRFNESLLHLLILLGQSVPSYEGLYRSTCNTNGSYHLLTRKSRGLASKTRSLIFYSRLQAHPPWSSLWHYPPLRLGPSSSLAGFGPPSSSVLSSSAPQSTATGNAASLPRSSQKLNDPFCTFSRHRAWVPQLARKEAV